MCVIITVLIRRIARAYMYNNSNNNIVYTFRKIVLKPRASYDVYTVVQVCVCVLVCVIKCVCKACYFSLQRAVLTLPSQWIGCAALSLHNNTIRRNR